MIRRRRDDGGAGEPPLVLVVTEDPSGGEILRRLLAREGYRVDLVPGHEECTARLGVDHPAVVVVDLGGGGIGANLRLLDVIRSHPDPTAAKTRVVLITEHNRNQMFSWQAGVDAFVVRPFHANDFVREVAEVLARSEEERGRHRRRQLEAAQRRRG